MSIHRSFMKKHPPRPALIALAALALCGGALLLPGCEHDPFVDTHVLPEGLIGTWKASFEGGFTDTYVISDLGPPLGTVSHPEFNLTGTIKYVYNFSASSGSLIVQRADDQKFTAVFFNDLSKTTVKLGDAFGPAPDYAAAVAATLEEAKTKFGPANANRYGGADANKASPLTKQ